MITTKFLLQRSFVHTTSEEEKKGERKKKGEREKKNYLGFVFFFFEWFLARQKGRLFIHILRNYNKTHYN